MRAVVAMLTLIGCLAGGLAPCSAADPERWVNPPGKPPPGVEHKTFRSNSMKLDVGYNIYLPPDYAKSQRRFPVVYFLHQLGANESSLLMTIRTLDQAIKEKKVAPCILVLPNAGKTSWYADSADAKVMGETIVIKELIPHVDKTYRTIAKREGRAVQGYSMGGFGALKFAFKYPEMFGSVVAYSQAWQPELRATLDRNLKRIRGKVAVRVIVAARDKDCLEPSRQMHARLVKLKVPHEFAEVADAGHSIWDGWPKEFLVEPQRRWLGRVSVQRQALPRADVAAASGKLLTALGR
jgi:endo-1,4-beta-xylanase